MANKTLSQVIGASNHEIGDIIETKATSLPDGKVLLPLDGTIITPASYPLLEALMDPGATGGQMRKNISSNGDALQDDLANKQAIFAFVADDSVRVLSFDDDEDILFQDAAAVTQIFAPPIGVSQAGNAAGSADGNEMIVSTHSLSGAELRIYYTLTGDEPFTDVAAISSGDSIIWNVMFCNRAGTEARAVLRNNTDATIETFKSGANIGTGWTSVNAYSYSVAPDGKELFASSDDFATMTVGATGGLSCTFDSGANWTENEVLPGYGYPPSGVCVDETDIVWCVNSTNSFLYSGDTLYKTTNGTTFTEVLTSTDAVAYTQDPRITNVRFLDIFSDSSSNLYMIAQGEWGGGSATNTSVVMPALMLFYSEDAGVTWTGNVLASGITDAGTNEDWSLHKFKMSPNCDVLMFTPTGAASSCNFMDITTGLVLSISPRKKIVADAP